VPRGRKRCGAGSCGSAAFSDTNNNYAHAGSCTSGTAGQDGNSAASRCNGTVWRQPVHDRGPSQAAMRRGHSRLG
jgi:hypothetical protein